MKNQSPLTKSFDPSELVKLYKNGYSLRDIAVKLGVSHPTVCKHLSRAGIRRRGVRHGGRPTKSPFDPRTNARFGIYTVITKDPHLYPTRWRCKCICGRYILADKGQLLRGRQTCTHKHNYKPRWKKIDEENADLRRTGGREDGAAPVNS